MTTTTAKHTAPPYAVKPLRDQTNGMGFRIEQQHGSTAARLMNIAIVGSKEDADFIVRACNAHDDLLAACKALSRRMDAWARCGNPPQHEDKAAMSMARAAIRKAGGEA